MEYICGKVRAEAADLSRGFEKSIDNVLPQNPVIPPSSDSL